jgi:hypothetical protein
MDLCRFCQTLGLTHGGTQSYGVTLRGMLQMICHNGHRWEESSDALAPLPPLIELDAELPPPPLEPPTDIGRLLSMPDF